MGTAIRFQLRHQVTDRSGGECEARWDDLCSGLGETLHHVVSRADHGIDTPANLIHACGTCHNSIHAHPFEAARRGLLMEPTYTPMVDGLPLAFRRAVRQHKAARDAWRAVCAEQHRIGMERKALKRYRQRMEEQARVRAAA